MTKPNHTPGEWSTNLWASGRITIESGNGQVCELNVIHGPGTPKGNANHIERAVNAHDDLVGALKIALSWLSDSEDDGDIEVTTKIKNALKKAEG